MNITNKIGVLSKDAKNPFFKSQYLTLNQLLLSLLPLLEEEGLMLTNYVADNHLVTVVNDDEDKIESAFPIAENIFNNPQAVGSTLTYARRYNLVSIFNIMVEDDDANAGSKLGKSPQPQTSKDDNRKWLNEGSPEWIKIVDRIKGGESIKINTVKMHYKLAKSSEVKLMELMN